MKNYYVIFKAKTPEPGQVEKAAKNPLITKVAKKGQKHSADIYKRTRLGTDLTPSDPSMAKFNLKNLSAALDIQQIKYLFQEFAKLTMTQFEKMELNPAERGEVVASLLKQYQKMGVYALADTAVFIQEPNVVSFLIYHAKFENLI